MAPDAREPRLLRVLTDARGRDFAALDDALGEAGGALVRRARVVVRGLSPVGVETAHVNGTAFFRGPTGRPVVSSNVRRCCHAAAAESQAACAGLEVSFSHAPQCSYAGEICGFAGY